MHGFQLIYFYDSIMPVSVSRAKQRNCRPSLHPRLPDQHGRPSEGPPDSQPWANDREVQYPQHGPGGHESGASSDARNALWALGRGGDLKRGCNGEQIFLGGKFDQGQNGKENMNLFDFTS